MRALGLDVGNKRIGVAVSDPTGLLASAERVIRRRSLANDIAALAALVDELGAETIVVGLPLHLDGRAGEQAESVQRFVERLRAHVSVPIVFWDERLSTRGAQALLIEAGMGAAQRAARIDAAAAAVILQSYLEYQRQARQRAHDAADDAGEP